VARFAGYVPESALTPAELARYRRELRVKRARYPHLFKGEAAAAGLRARILSQRGTINL
jgi:hypothetical protein